MYSTRHVFSFLHACRHAYARKIDDVETLVQSTRVCTTHVAEARMHVRLRTRQIWFACTLACIRIVKPSINSIKLYEHVS